MTESKVEVVKNIWFLREKIYCGIQTAIIILLIKYLQQLKRKQVD